MNLTLNEIIRKDEKKFKKFFENYYEDFVLFANKYLFDKDSSEDIVQEVFIYLWENASNLKIETSLKGYLYTMIRNRCLNYLKSIKITDNYEFLEFNLKLTTEQDLSSISEDEKKIVYHQILKIVDSLPEKMREIVKLRFIYNYKYLEIAKELNISVNTVKTQLKRAKLKIIKSVTIIAVLIHLSS
ncbi:RNA polymerase sigma-70 factor [Seonamhaeicola sp. NFXS20]|uniref:RNA polymerase sigma-70 factor n=1 Tax=Seonamhaeicola sp. NFXS20 TaxID=2816959 RepID=UPI003B8C53DA